jgi:hypothetical protein
MKREELAHGTDVYWYDQFAERVIHGCVTGRVPESTLVRVSLKESFGESGEKTGTLTGSVKQNPHDLHPTLQDAYVSAKQQRDIPAVHNISDERPPVLEEEEPER